MFAATDMPFFKNCRTVASYIFACARLAEFSFQRAFLKACTKSFAPLNNNKKLRGWLVYIAYQHRTLTE